MTTDRHKVKPMSLRLPEALSAWVKEYAAREGIPVRQVILAAIAEKRDRDAAAAGSASAQQESPGQDTRPEGRA